MANETPCDRCGHVMEDVSVENEQAREKGHNIQPALRRQRFRCPECGAEKTVAETAHDREVESWENEGGEVRGARTKARGKDRSHGRWTIDRGPPWFVHAPYPGRHMPGGAP